MEKTRKYPIEIKLCKEPKLSALGSFPYGARYHFEISHHSLFKTVLGPACHIICRGAAFRSIIEEENFFGGFIL
jgi:hypothetical protein